MERTDNNIFNMEKLPAYFNDFINKKVAIVGLGAVGSYLAEFLIKMKVFQMTLIDFDPYEKENSAKSSSVYKPNEDSGKNKARALAEDLNEHFEIDTVHGIDASITCFGPMAFAGYDVLILALDNYAAKLFSNQIWLQIPKNKRPILIFGGTIGESAQSSCLDGRDGCVRCHFDERWLVDLLVRTSCTGINYRPTGDFGEHAITTGLASAYSALLMAEQCRGYFVGHKDMINRKMEYTAYPNLGFTTIKPMKRASCPDCKNYHPVENAEALQHMDVIHTTVGELFDVLKTKFPEGKIEITAPFIEFGKIAYSKIIKDDFCRCCGKALRGLYKHEFRTKYEDLLCDECKTSGRKASNETKYEKLGTTIGSITVNNCEDSLINKTLYEIGFAVGGFIKVIHYTDDDDIFGEGVEFHTFYCADDSKQMRLITKLEG